MADDEKPIKKYPTIEALAYHYKKYSSHYQSGIVPWIQQHLDLSTEMHNKMIDEYDEHCRSATPIQRIIEARLPIE